MKTKDKLKGASQELNITLITCAPSDTLGDVSSCKKFIDGVTQLVSNDIPKAKFNLVITGVDKEATKNRILALLENSDKYNLMLVSSKERDFFQRPEFDSTDAFVFYPSFQITPDNDIQALKKRKKPTFIVGHYNFDSPTDKRYAAKKQLWMPSLQTGLGPDSLGVYIEDAESRPLRFNQKDNDLWNLLLPNGTDYTHIKAYSDNTTLFFGYMNKLGFLESRRNIANPYEFAKASIDKSLKQYPSKSIDIMVRLNDKTQDVEFNYYDQLIENFEALKRSDLQITIYKKNKEGEIQKTKTIGSGNTKVRIIDPFPIQHGSMLSMMKLSDPFCMMTGSESFVESLSCGKLPLYQIMSWHDKLYNKLLEEIESITELGRNSLLYKYFSYQSKDENKSYIDLVNFISENEAELLRDMSVFKKYLIENKQLSEKLHRKLCSMLDPRMYIYECLDAEKIDKIASEPDQEPELANKIEALPGSIMQLMAMFPNNRDDVICACRRLFQSLFEENGADKKAYSFVKGYRKLQKTTKDNYLHQVLFGLDRDTLPRSRFINAVSSCLEQELLEVEKQLLSKYPENDSKQIAQDHLNEIKTAWSTLVMKIINSSYPNESDIKTYINQFNNDIKKPVHEIDKMLGHGTLFKACEYFVKFICAIVGCPIIGVMSLSQSGRDKVSSFFSPHRTKEQKFVSQYKETSNVFLSVLDVPGDTEQNSEQIRAIPK